MINKNNTVEAACLLQILLALILGGCGLGARRPISFFEKNNIQTGAEAIKTKIGGPFNVFKVEIDKDKFTMQIQSPQNADNLREY